LDEQWVEVRRRVRVHHCKSPFTAGLEKIMKTEKQ
jgi:hypothetical protein